MEKAATAEETARSGVVSSKTRAENEVEIKCIMQDIKKVLAKLEDAVPLLNLAITTSGASLSTTLPSSVSPSRLLQASTFVTTCDTQYSMSPFRAVQTGPTFTLSMYMLFASHVRPQDDEAVRETTWKEVMHKARIRLRRVPIDTLFESDKNRKRQSRVPANGRADEFAYQITVVEDLDDGRVHTFEDAKQQPQSYDGVQMAGLRLIIPIHQISKIFYADTSKILNIRSDSETNTPILLLKRDINAIPPRRAMEQDEVEYEQLKGPCRHGDDDETQLLLDAQLNGDGPLADEVDYLESLSEKGIPDQWRLPPGLDPEWIAFEVYHEDQEEDTDSDTESISPIKDPPETPVDAQGISSLNLQDISTPQALTGSLPVTSTNINDPSTFTSTSTVTNPLFNNIRTSLSLLEMLLRLTSLQQFQQQSHLSITDELLNFFLEESSTTGAGGDEQHRRYVRNAARRKVGWDPYDESPLKRHGEDYQYHYGGGSDYSFNQEDQYRYVDPDNRENSYYSPAIATAKAGRAGKNLQIRSREITPDITSSPSLPDVHPESAKRISSFGGRRAFSQPHNDEYRAAVRRGFPLSRGSMTLQADEGIGTSPTFVNPLGAGSSPVNVEIKPPPKHGR